MRPTRLAALAALLTVVAARPAPAAPYVGVVRSASVDIPFVGSDKRPWQVGVTIVYGVAGTEMKRYAVLRLSQCDAKRHCTYTKLWQQDVGLTDVTEGLPDGSQVTVSTTFAGRPISVSWTRLGSTNETIHVTGGADDTASYPTSATATYAGVTCGHLEGTGYERRAAWANGSPYSDGPKAPATTAIPKAVRGPVRCAT